MKISELRTLVSVALSKLLSAVDGDQNSDEYKKLKTKMQDFVRDSVSTKDPEKNFQGLSALSSILLADTNIGVETFLAQAQGVIESIQVLIEDEDEAALVVKKLASEILAHAAGNKQFQVRNTIYFIFSIFSILLFRQIFVIYIHIFLHKYQSEFERPNSPIFSRKSVPHKYWTSYYCCWHLMIPKSRREWQLQKPNWLQEMKKSSTF